MRKLLLSAIFIAGVFASAYSLSKAAGLNPTEKPSAESEAFSPENEPFVLTMRQSRLHIDFAPDYRNGIVSMFDILGNKVFELPANEAVDYSVANLKSGLYFIVLKGPQGNFTRKFLHKQEG